MDFNEGDFGGINDARHRVRKTGRRAQANSAPEEVGSLMNPFFPTLRVKYSLTKHSIDLPHPHPIPFPSCVHIHVAKIGVALQEEGSGATPPPSGQPKQGGWGAELDTTEDSAP